MLVRTSCFSNFQSNVYLWFTGDSPLDGQAEVQHDSGMVSFGFFVAIQFHGFSFLYQLQKSCKKQV